jgi:putative membrane protein
VKFTFARTVFRFIVVWVVDIASLLFTAAIFPGIGFTEGSNPLVVATSAAFLLGIVNFLIRPLILLLALPFGLIAIFIVGFFLNAIALVLTAWLVPGLFVNGALDAFFGSIVLAALNTLLTSVIAVDDDDSFYQNLVERIAGNPRRCLADRVCVCPALASRNGTAV